jgi:predicted dehydrogenase
MQGETFNLKRLAVLGGGRWARVVVGVLHQIVPPDVFIRVYTPHNAAAMRKWAAERHLENVTVLDFEPDFSQRDTADVAVVANAAHGHMAMARRAVDAGVPTLVEKPLALTAADASEIVELAQRNHVLLASSRVLLFARYIHEFGRLIEGLEAIESVHIAWVDPADETRYGEIKRFEPEVVLSHDLLPHVLPVLKLLVGGSNTLTDVALNHGGSQTEIRMQAGNIPCTLSLARNGSARRRVITVRTAQHSFTLDFSQEPGQIAAPGRSYAGDPLWNVEPRPLASMLQCFLNCVATGKIDERLSARTAIAECRFSDEVLSVYLQRQGEWLAARSGQPMDDGIRYALVETLTWHDRTRSLGDDLILPIWTAMNTRDHSAIREAFARGDRDSVVRMLREGIA